MPHSQLDASPPAPGAARRAVLWGGLLAGSGDLVFALVYYGFSLRVFQTVAAGVLGRSAAYAGGVATFLLGVVLHYGIALVWAALYWVAARRFPVLLSQAVAAGLGFGLVVYFGMNCVVLPLSALRTKPWPPNLAGWPIVMHMLVVGLPIALAARRLTPTGAGRVR